MVGAPAYHPSRNASRSTSSSSPNSAASSRQLPVAQPLEHSKTKSSAAEPTAVVGRPLGHQHRPVVAQRVPPDPAHRLGGREAPQRRVEVVRRGGVHPARTRVEGRIAQLGERAHHDGPVAARAGAGVALQPLQEREVATGGERVRLAAPADVVQPVAGPLERVAAHGRRGGRDRSCATTGPEHPADRVGQRAGRAAGSPTPGAAGPSRCPAAVAGPAGRAGRQAAVPRVLGAQRARPAAPTVRTVHVARSSRVTRGVGAPRRVASSSAADRVRDEGRGRRPPVGYAGPLRRSPGRRARSARAAAATGSPGSARRRRSSPPGGPPHGPTTTASAVRCTRARARAPACGSAAVAASDRSTAPSGDHGLAPGPRARAAASSRRAAPTTAPGAGPVAGVVVTAARSSRNTRSSTSARPRRTRAARRRTRATVEPRPARSARRGAASLR